MDNCVSMGSKSLIDRTIEWAWERDEVGQPSTRQTVAYTITLYVIALSLIVVSGVVLSYLGFEAAAFSLLIFGIWFTAFMGVVNIGWEWLKYRSDDRRSGRSQAPTGPERELAPDIKIDVDTKIGFIVTVAGLLSLLLSFQVALFIVSHL